MACMLITLEGGLPLYYLGVLISDLEDYCHSNPYQGISSADTKFHLSVMTSHLWYKDVNLWLVYLFICCRVYIYLKWNASRKLFLRAHLTATALFYYKHPQVFSLWIIKPSYFLSGHRQIFISIAYMHHHKFKVISNIYPVEVPLPESYYCTYLRYSQSTANDQCGKGISCSRVKEVNLSHVVGV